MTRYKMKFGHLVEAEDGDWVKWEDLEQTINNLLEELDALQKENYNNLYFNS